MNKRPDLHFVLASGRSRPASAQIRENLDIVKRTNTESILCNGCIIYDYDNSILWQGILSPEFLKKVHKLYKPSPESVYFYCVGDDAILYDEEWARRLRDEYEEQTVVENMEEYIEKIESGQVKINKVGFLIPDRSKADGMYYKIHDFIYFTLN